MTMNAGNDSMTEPLISASESHEEDDAQPKQTAQHLTNNAEGQEVVYEKMSKVTSPSKKENESVLTEGGQEEFPRAIAPAADQEVSESSPQSMQSLPLSTDSPGLASLSTEGSELYEPVAVRVQALEETIRGRSPVYEATTVPVDRSPVVPERRSSARKGSTASSGAPSLLTRSPASVTPSAKKHASLSPFSLGQRSSGDQKTGFFFSEKKADAGTEHRVPEYQNAPRKNSLKGRASPMYVNSPIFSPKRQSDGSAAGCQRSSLDDIKRKAWEEADAIELEQDYNESRRKSSSTLFAKKGARKRVVLARGPIDAIRRGSRQLWALYEYDKQNNPNHRLKMIGMAIILVSLVVAIVLCATLAHFLKKPKTALSHTNSTTSHNPGTAHSQAMNPPDSHDWNEVDSQAVNPSDSQDVNEADKQDVNEADSQDVNKADSQDVNKADNQDVNEADSQDVNKADSQNVNKADNQDVNEADSQDVNKADSQDVNEADNQDLNEADSQDVNKADSQDVNEADNQDVNEADSQDVNEADSQALTPSDSQAENPPYIKYVDHRSHNISSMDYEILVQQINLTIPSSVDVGLPMKIGCYLQLVAGKPPTSAASEEEKQAYYSKEAAKWLKHLQLLLSNSKGSQDVLAESSPKPLLVVQHRPGVSVSGTYLTDPTGKLQLEAHFSRSTCLDEGDYTCELFVYGMYTVRTTGLLQVKGCDKREQVLREMQPELKMIPDLINLKTRGGQGWMECSLPESYRPYLLWVDHIIIQRIKPTMVVVAGIQAGQKPQWRASTFFNAKLEGSTSLGGSGPHLRFLWYPLSAEHAGSFRCEMKVHTSVAHMATVISPLSDLKHVCAFDLGWQVKGSVCLQLRERRVTWEEAQRECEARAGTLLKIRSQTEHTEVKRYLKERPRTGALWVGVNVKKGSDGQLRVSPPPTPSDGACIAILPSENYKLAWVSCNEKKAYLCQPATWS